MCVNNIWSLVNNGSYNSSYYNRKITVDFGDSRTVDITWFGFRGKERKQGKMIGGGGSEARFILIGINRMGSMRNWLKN
jgi:hypothetical protein